MDVLKHIDAAQDELGAVCKDLPKRFRMSIPVDEKYDTDMIIGNALKRSAAEITGLQEKVKELEREAVRMRNDYRIVLEQRDAALGVIERTDEIRTALQQTSESGR